MISWEERKSRFKQSWYEFKFNWQNSYNVASQMVRGHEEHNKLMKKRKEESE